MNAAGSRPFVGGVEVSIPLEHPQLFEPDFSRRAIQENGIHETIVPVNAKALYRISAAAWKTRF